MSMGTRSAKIPASPGRVAPLLARLCERPIDDCSSDHRLASESNVLPATSFSEVSSAYHAMAMEFSATSACAGFAQVCPQCTAQTTGVESKELARVTADVKKGPQPQSWVPASVAKARGVRAGRCPKHFTRESNIRAGSLSSNLRANEEATARCVLSPQTSNLKAVFDALPS
jgi:hypothetical protein